MQIPRTINMTLEDEERSFCFSVSTEIERNKTSSPKMNIGLGVSPYDDEVKDIQIVNRRQAKKRREEGIYR